METAANEAAATSFSYTEAVRARMAHAPVKPSVSKEQAMAEKLQRHETVEPELVATTTHMGQFAKIHSTIATPGEAFPEGVERSSAGFLIKTASHKVALSKDKVQKEMEFY